MRPTTDVLRERLEDRFARLGDVLVQRIEDQRAVGSMARTLDAIADAVASDLSNRDVSGLEAREQQVGSASRTDLGAKQAARAIAGIKPRLLVDPSRPDSSTKGSSPGPSKRSIAKEVVGTWSTGARHAELGLGIKEAIAVAL